MSLFAHKTSLREWDRRFHELAKQVSSWSKDPDRPVGAVIVSADRKRVAFGYNGFPRQIPDAYWRLNDKALKNQAMIHAEANALDNAQFDVTGCAIYVTRFPCLDCAKRIISRGLSHVIAPEPPWDHPRWGESWRQSRDILGLAGIKIRLLPPDKEPQ